MHRTALRTGFHVSPGPLGDTLSALSGAAASAAAGLFRRDPATWSSDAAVQRTIANRLGWLTSPALMVENLDRLTALGAAIRDSNLEEVVLLGMGGSSLAPEVLRAVLGIEPGWPRLHMLDSTDPAAVRAIAAPAGLSLFVLASKSGTTIEPNSLAAYFRQALEASQASHWARHFLAITDEGTELDARARVEQFRDVFVNPSDIGGRYSALSFFGMVPAALMGQDAASLLGWGLALLDEAQTTGGDVLENPAVGLGLVMGAGAKAGRDKLTLVVPPLFEPFGLWVEQLVAESTGKQGVGVIPIAGETLGDRRVYGDDRLFVRLRMAGDPDEERRDRAMEALRDAPIVTIDVTEPAALGAEFARWEIATAVAGALLGINPFDEPNVQQAKDATRGLLERYRIDGRLPISAPDHTMPGGATLTLSDAAKEFLAGEGARSFLRLLAPGEYLAILAYLGPDAAIGDAFHRFRMSVRDRTANATMFGYGPRYLHSTGQLHKGGPNSGVFVLVTAAPTVDVAIPGQGYSFGTLELAQALGDFASLDTTGRRALHVHLPSPEPRALDRLLTSLADEAPSRT
jgi:glucose-6-phosphate isomerase